MKTYNDLDRLSISQLTAQSAAYDDACQLRHTLFFAEQNLPFAMVFDQYEERSEHWAIVRKDIVLAYGRVTKISDICVSVSQVAVRPRYQRHGLGKRIMQQLEDRAFALNVKHIILYARESAIPFYKKLDYIGRGDLFPSSKTGILHLEMKKRLRE